VASRPNEVNDFLNLCNLAATLGPEVYSASNRNEYQKHKNNYFILTTMRLADLTGLTLFAIISILYLCPL
jgi:hypothetical protein